MAVNSFLLTLYDQYLVNKVVTKIITYVVLPYEHT